MNSSSKSQFLDRQARLLFVFMVVVGYAVTVATIIGQGVSNVTPSALILGVSFGIIYVLLGLNNNLIYDHIPAGWADVLFFSLECSLVFGIGLMLGTSGSAFIGVPLAAFAVEKLAPRPRWLVYAALIAVVILPRGLRTGAWIDAMFDGLIASAAVFFVAIFAQMRFNEQHAREHAEQLMEELEQANLQLAAYAAQAEEFAMTQERNRLAREIHDSLGHYLTVVNVQIEAAKAVQGSDPARALDALNKAQELNQKGLARVRESVAALRESPVSSRPLTEAIAALVDEAQSTGIITEFKVSGEPQTLEHKKALALYRAAQEGLTNVRRHASASRVDILLEFTPAEVCLQVKDNGVGAAETGGGFGLLGIRERMHLLGGKLEITTGVGQGFILKACLPISAEDRQITPEE